MATRLPYGRKGFATVLPFKPKKKPGIKESEESKAIEAYLNSIPKSKKGKTI